MQSIPNGSIIFIKLPYIMFSEVKLDWVAPYETLCIPDLNQLLCIEPEQVSLKEETSTRM